MPSWFPGRAGWDRSSRRDAHTWSGSELSNENSSSGGLLQADAVGHRERSIGALLEFDGGKKKLRVADILDAVQEIFPGAVSHVLRVARKMLHVDDSAIL